MLYSSVWRARLLATPVLFWNLGAISEEAKAPPAVPTPTCDAPEYRQFDFWLGKWNVTEGHQPAGQNNIEPDLKRCALFESWTATDGSRGRSINFYDCNKRRWHQTWIDDRGGVLELDGGLVGDSMVLEGSRANAGSGAPTRQRITWTPNPDGSVRQHWQMKKLVDSPWKTVFDGLYTRHL